MRVPRSVLIVSGALALATCMDAGPTSLDWEGTPAFGLVPGPPDPFCGVATVVGLVADGDVVVGIVEVVNDGAALFVTYRTDADVPLIRTALAVAGDPADIPTTGSGNPQPGRFPYKARHRGGPTAVTWRVDVPVNTGEILHVAAFAEVRLDGEEEGAWGDGRDINPSSGWATRFPHAVQSCDGTIIRIVPTTGGTIVTEGLELVIPDGSLVEETAITIAQTTFEDPDAPPIVAGTTWELGPSGTTFDPPALLTLAYDPANLPLGFPEANLKCFLANGAFELIEPTSIDQVNNVITCAVTHFSVVGVTAPGGGTIAATIAEAIGVTDLVTINVRSPARPDIAEAIGVSDQVTVNVRSPARPDVAEMIGVTDDVTVNVRSPARPDVAEAIGVSDQVTVNVRSPARPDVAEAIGVSDAVTVNVRSPVRSNVDEAIGVTDDVTVTVVPAATADLEILAGGPSTVTIGDPATYGAFVSNLGPDPVADATVAYRILGDAVAGPLEPGCVETVEPTEADVEIVCTVGAIDTSRPVQAPTATFEPQSEGDYTVRILVGSAATDPNPDNNEFETPLTVTGPQTDLRVNNFLDDRDPILAGDQVTYGAEVRLAGGTLETVDGAVLRILFDGDANFVSSTSPCSAIAGGVSCPVPTLTFGFPSHTFDIVMMLPTPGDITAEAVVDPPAGVADLDLSNNTAVQTTTVGELPPTTIAVGDIVEAVLPAPNDTTWYAFEVTATRDVRFHLSLLPGTIGSAQLVIDLVGDEEPPFFPGGLPQGAAQDGLSANVVLTFVPGSYRVGVTSGVGEYRLGVGTGEGRVDGGFGVRGDGFAFGPFESGNPFRQMELVGDATLVVGDEQLVKFDANGEFDAGFGTNGVIELDELLGVVVTSYSAAVQADGRIVVASVAALSPRPWVIARLDATGALDPTFGTGGIVEVAGLGDGLASRPLGVGFQQDGADLDIVIAGAGDPQNNVAMVRLNPDGSVDTGFGTEGIVFEAVGFTPDAVEVQPDGRIVILDSRQIMRYTADGARDATFGTNGLADLGILGGAQGVTVLPDGDLLVVGTLSNQALVIRLTPSGALDASFAGGGLQTYSFGHREMFKAATVTPAGDLLLVGHQRTIDDGWEFLIAKMSQAGVLDMDFGVAGYTIEGGGDEARAVLFDSMGRFLVGGQQMGAGNRIELSRHFLN